MEQSDVERIARATLKDLGLPGAEVTIVPVQGQPGHWRIEIKGRPKVLKITCGEGSSAQWVRQQILEQYSA